MLFTDGLGGMDYNIKQLLRLYCLSIHHFMGEDKSVTHPASIRRMAEDQFKKGYSLVTPEFLNLDTDELLQELQICKIELEIQHKILQQAKEQFDTLKFSRTTESLNDSEIRYQKLFESSKDGILIIDAVSGKILNLNPYLLKLLGYSRDELIGKELWEVDSFKWVGYTKHNFIELQIRGDIRYSDMPLVVKDGKSISVEFISTVFVANHIKVIQCNFRDITERKRVEKALKDSEARLIALNSTKDKFFSIIAHDLKGPFNSIIGFSDLLVERIREEDYEGIEKYAMIIQNSSRRAMELIMNLLEWSRSQTGKLSFKPENMDMTILIKTISQLLNDSAQQKSITLYTEMPEQVNAYADKAMMATVLRNLISNAIKFTKEGGEIIISVNEEPDKVIVTVSDNGVGIKPEALGKLFFIEHSYSTIGTNNEKGTGLGLVLCKEFMDKHEGDIWVESEVGVGSKFHISIPVNPKKKHHINDNAAYKL